jgi:hypothetical protein
LVQQVVAEHKDWIKVILGRYGVSFPLDELLPSRRRCLSKLAEIMKMAGVVYSIEKLTSILIEAETEVLGRQTASGIGYDGHHSNNPDSFSGLAGMDNGTSSSQSSSSIGSFHLHENHQPANAYGSCADGSLTSQPGGPQLISQVVAQTGNFGHQSVNHASLMYSQQSGASPVYGCETSGTFGVSQRNGLDQTANFSQEAPMYSSQTDQAALQAVNFSQQAPMYLPEILNPTWNEHTAAPSIVTNGKSSNHHTQNGDPDAGQNYSAQSYVGV